MNNFNTITLENGVKIITVPMDNTNASTVLLLFGAGSRYETPDIAGSSHLFEHLLFKGTEKRKTPKEIAQVVESKGGILNAYTDKESTGYWCKVPSTSYKEGIEVLIDMAKQPLIREEDLSMEKNVVYEEIKAYLDSASSRASNKSDENLWPNQPMGVDIAGSIETVEATSREDLMKYLKKQYTASNTVLVVTGNIDEKSVIDIAKKNFEGFREGKPLNYEKSFYNNEGPLTVLDKMETNQTHLTLAFKNYSMKDASRYSSSILSVILGGGMTSRLFEQVREKRGLAYSVSANSHFYSDCGVFYIDAGVAPENTEETFKVIIQELNNLKNNLSIEEITSSKELIKGRLMMRYEDSRSVAMNYGTQELLNGKITSIDENLKSLEKVTYDEIISTFDYIFNNKTMIVSAAGSIENVPNLTKNKDFF
tara:strand:+ start:3644 stop:4915 length:1272 start_codon:yes stop_codon:yes gene_type:complete